MRGSIESSQLVDGVYALVLIYVAFLLRRNVSMIKLVQRFLMNADRRKYLHPPELIMPDDIVDKAFASPEPGRTHAFFANTKDKHLVASIASFIPGISIASTIYLPPKSNSLEWRSSLEGADKCVALVTPETMADVVMQQQIEAALDLSMDVVLIHDLRQPNNFTDILTACPKRLRDKGIFNQLAVALYNGEYQHTSLKLLWQRLTSTGSGAAAQKRERLLRESMAVESNPMYNQMEGTTTTPDKKSIAALVAVEEPNAEEVVEL
jgi:hypothetical protein